MTTDYKVAEVELSYRNRVPYKDRKKVVTSEDAYNILLNNQMMIRLIILKHSRFYI